MKWDILFMLTVFALLIALIVFGCMKAEQWDAECRALGGISIRGSSGYECIKAEKLK